MKEQTSLERTAALTKRILAVPKAEIEGRAKAVKRRHRRTKRPRA